MQLHTQCVHGLVLWYVSRSSLQTTAMRELSTLPISTCCHLSSVISVFKASSVVLQTTPLLNARCPRVFWVGCYWSKCCWTSWLLSMCVSRHKLISTLLECRNEFLTLTFSMVLVLVLTFWSCFHHWHCVPKNTHSRFLLYLPGKRLDLNKIFRECLWWIRYTINVNVKYSFYRWRDYDVILFTYLHRACHTIDARDSVQTF